MVYSSSFPNIQERLLKRGYTFPAIWEVFRSHLGWAISHFAAEVGPDQALYRAELELWKYFWDEKIHVFPGEEPRSQALPLSETVASQVQSGIGINPRPKSPEVPRPSPRPFSAICPAVATSEVVAVKASWVQRAMDQIKQEMGHAPGKELLIFSPVGEQQEKRPCVSVETEKLRQAPQSPRMDAHPNLDIYEREKIPYAKVPDVDEMPAMRSKPPSLKPAQHYYDLKGSGVYYERQLADSPSASQSIAQPYPPRSSIPKISKMQLTSPVSTCHDYHPGETFSRPSTCQHPTQLYRSPFGINNLAENDKCFRLGMPSTEKLQKANSIGFRGQQPTRGTRMRGRSASPEPEHRYPLRSATCRSVECAGDIGARENSRERSG
ncbi:uncharacterized protein BP5553_04239 [Venustampulla echinocandica]|uniref:Uncharacterized protein n=1 Tax=Venustampulla echinocandica TaxID=2656787 RepID=A0A370TWK3_9HELO|nr:uncharacterized protein BP5553_04239 [Venustampulla echinocandica]RDL39899.1 hypothetical protein BP5553_04239 [Venustampulla echinocandica]